jgi:hypothetical protein
VQGVGHGDGHHRVVRKIAASPRTGEILRFYVVELVHGAHDISHYGTKHRHTSQRVFIIVPRSAFKSTIPADFYRTAGLKNRRKIVKTAHKIDITLNGCC